MTPWIFAPPYFYYLNFKAEERHYAARFEKETGYSTLRLEQDLLDDWIIITLNGRIKSKIGQTKTVAFINFNEAFERFCFIAKERNQRGYHLINIQGGFLFQQILFLYITGNLLPSILQKNSTIAPVKRTRLLNKAPVFQSQFSEIQQLSFVF